MIKLLTTKETYKDCKNLYTSDNSFTTIGEPKGKRHRITIGDWAEETDYYLLNEAFRVLGLGEYFDFCYHDGELIIQYYVEEAAAND